MEINAEEFIRRMGEKCGADCFQRCKPQFNLACDAVCIVMEMIKEQQDEQS